MALNQYIGNQAAQTGRLPGAGKPKVKKKPAAKLTAKQKAENAALNDPYGVGHGPQGPKRKRVVRKKVRRRRVGPQTTAQTSTSELNKSQQQQAAQKSKHTGRPGQTRSGGLDHMFRQWNATQNLQQAAHQFKAGQQGKPQGPKSDFGKKMYTLSGLNGYLSNDYAAMKANQNDKSFTYRTAEARQLQATIGTMLAGSTKLNKKDDKKSSNSSDNRLTPAAFGRKKGLLRQLMAMSEPNAPLPEGLPADYKPFEGVA